MVFVTTQEVADLSLTPSVYHIGKRLNPMATKADQMQQHKGNPELGPWMEVDGEGGRHVPARAIADHPPSGREA